MSTTNEATMAMWQAIWLAQQTTNNMLAIQAANEDSHTSATSAVGFSQNALLVSVIAIIAAASPWKHLIEALVESVIEVLLISTVGISKFAVLVCTVGIVAAASPWKHFIEALVESVIEVLLGI